MISEEIWKDIIGYEGLYQISNLSSVRSINRVVVGHNKKKYNKLGRTISFHINKFGYVQYNLYKNKNRRHEFAHRLVAIHFIKNPKNKPCVNHKNGIKADNRLENLEWTTYSENNLHSYRILSRAKPVGLIGRAGKLHPRAKNIFQFNFNGELIKKWECIKDAEIELGIGSSRICDTANGRSNHAGGYKWKYTIK